MSVNFLPLVLGLIYMFSLGTVYATNSRLSKQVGALKGVFLFQLLGLPLMLPLLVSSGLRFEPSFFLPILLGFAFTGILMLSFYSLKIGSAGIISPISQTSSMITFFLGILVLSEEVNLYKIISALMVVGGVVLLSLNFLALKKTKKEYLYKGVPYAIAFSVGAGVFMFLAGNISRRIGWVYNSFLIKSSIAFLTFLIILFRQKGFRFNWEKIPWKIAFLTAALDVIGFSTYNFAVTRFQFSYMAVFSSAASLVTMLIAVTILKEKMFKHQWVGALLVVFGLIGLQIH